MPELENKREKPNPNPIPNYQRKLFFLLYAVCGVIRIGSGILGVIGLALLLLSILGAIIKFSSYAISYTDLVVLLAEVEIVIASIFFLSSKLASYGWKRYIHVD